MPTDEEILKAMAQPETLEKGFRMLVQVYQERLYWHIRRLVLTHQNADDVLQNTLVKVFRGIGNFKGDSQLYTWLYRIATNESLTFLEKEKKHAQADDVDDPIIQTAQQLSADEYFEGDEAERMLHEAIATLPERQRAVFHLRYYDEMPYEQMSEVLGVTVGALKASYHHAVKKIEAHFTGNPK